MAYFCMWKCFEEGDTVYRDVWRFEWIIFWEDNINRLRTLLCFVIKVYFYMGVFVFDK